MSEVGEVTDHLTTGSEHVGSSETTEKTIPAEVTEIPASTLQDIITTERVRETVSVEGVKTERESPLGTPTFPPLDTKPSPEETSSKLTAKPPTSADQITHEMSAGPTSDDKTKTMTEEPEKVEATTLKVNATIASQRGENITSPIQTVMLTSEETTGATVAKTVPGAPEETTMAQAMGKQPFMTTTIGRLGQMTNPDIMTNVTFATAETVEVTSPKAETSEPPRDQMPLASTSVPGDAVSTIGRMTPHSTKMGGKDRTTLPPEETVGVTTVLGRAGVTPTDKPEMSTDRPTMTSQGNPLEQTLVADSTIAGRVTSSAMEEKQKVSEVTTHGSSSLSTVHVTTSKTGLIEKATSDSYGGTPTLKGTIKHIVSTDKQMPDNTLSTNTRETRSNTTVDRSMATAAAEVQESSVAPIKLIPTTQHDGATAEAVTHVENKTSSPQLSTSHTVENISESAGSREPEISTVITTASKATTMVSMTRPSEMQLMAERVRNLEKENQGLSGMVSLQNTVTLMVLKLT